MKIIFLFVLLVNICSGEDSDDVDAPASECACCNQPETQCLDMDTADSEIMKVVCCNNEVGKQQCTGTDKDGQCIGNATYEGAEFVCSQQGLELCERETIWKGHCCDIECLSRDDRVWSKVWCSDGEVVEEHYDESVVDYCEDKFWEKEFEGYTISSTEAVQIDMTPPACFYSDFSNFIIHFTVTLDQGSTGTLQAFLRTSEGVLIAYMDVSPQGVTEDVPEGYPLNVTQEDFGDTTFEFCPPSDVGLSNQNLLNAEIFGGQPNISFSVFLEYEWALVSVGESYTKTASSHAQIAILRLGDEVNTNSIGIEVQAANRLNKVVGLLGIRLADNGCPTRNNLEVNDGTLTTISFTTQGQIVLSDQSTPPAISGKLYYIVVGLQDPAPTGTELDEQAFEYTVHVQINSPYNNWQAPFMLFFLIALTFSIGVLLMVHTFPKKEWCGTKFKAMSIDEHPRGFEARTQPFPATVRGWFFGSDLKYIPNEKNPRAQKNRFRRPFSFSWYTVIVGFAYGVSTVQFIFANWDRMVVTGDRDICYYNELCFIPSRTFDLPVNTLISNIGYIVLGAMWCLNVAIHEQQARARHDHSLYYALGWALVGEGFFSTFYHVCPTRTIFQFDTAFMFAIATLGIIALNQTGEDPDGGVKAAKFFLLFYVPLLFFNYLGIEMENFNYITPGGFWFVFLVWQICILLYVFHWFFRPTCCDCGSYLAQVYCTDCNKILWCHKCDDARKGSRRNGHVHVVPLKTLIKQWEFWAAFAYAFLFILSMILKALDILATPLASLILYLLIGALLFDMVYKVALDTHVHRGDNHITYLWSLTFIALMFSGVAAYFFLNETTDKSIPPYESREMNGRCIWLDYYGSHDVWHFFSSIAVSAIFGIILHLNPPVNTRERMCYHQVINPTSQFFQDSGIDSGTDGEGDQPVLELVNNKRKSLNKRERRRATESRRKRASFENKGEENGSQSELV